MTSTPVLPSTLDGLKRLAKSLHRDAPDLSYTHALDRAAVHCGYNNFTDAQRRMGTAIAVAPLYDGYLTAYWRNRRIPEQQQRTAGRETLHIRLSQPLDSLITWRQLDRGRNLVGFRFEFADHLELESNQDTLEEARDRLLAAARTLHFMDETGLRPATRQADRKGLSIEDLPERDHYSNWTDPNSGALLTLDEPYDHVDPRNAARSSWLERNGLNLFAPDWKGLYAPDHSRPYIIVADDQLGRRVVAQVETMQRQPRHARTFSAVVSAKYNDRFVSPARAATAKPTSKRTMPAYPGTTRAGAIAYGGAPGHKGRWRPERPMAFELHEKASTLLQSTAYLDAPWKAYTLVDQVKSRLEDWVLMEHRELMRDRHDVYYGANLPERPHTLHYTIQQLTTILRNGYQDCAPRREMLSKLEKALGYLDAGADKLTGGRSA